MRLIQDKFWRLAGINPGLEVENLGTANAVNRFHVSETLLRTILCITALSSGVADRARRNCEQAR